MKRKRLGTILCSMLLLITLIVTGAGSSVLAAEESADTAETTSSADRAKYINVVYDDSGSMIKEDGNDSSTEFYDKWCQAKYAMEVFSTMLSEDDTMNIYAMSDDGKVSLTITGDMDAQERADTIHDWESYSDETPYSVVKAAYSDLEEQGDDVETWLFVITDGAFDDGEMSTTAVKKNFDNYTASGVNVIYLGIGSDAAEYQSDTDAGLYCYHASDTADGESSEILDCMTGISNLISARLELDEQYITLEDGTLTLNIDAPMEEIIIFAQGDSIEIGDMENADSEVETESETKVTYSEAPTAALKSKYGSKLAVADYLSGVVKTFVSAQDGGVLSAGKYTVSLSGISDASDIKIYYKVNVDAALTITQNGEEIDPDDDYIEPGEVTIQAVIKDPDTGVTVNSDLMDDATVTYTITNGENTFTVTNDEDSDLYDGSVSADGSYTFTAQGGELVAHVVIHVDEGNDVEQELTYQVMTKDSALTIDEVTLEKDGGGNFKKKELYEEPGYATITVRQDGELLSEEFWMATEVAIETPEDSCLKVEVIGRGEDVSTYIVEVTYDYDKDLKDKTLTKDTKVDCTVSAKYELNGHAATSNDAVSTVTAERWEWMDLIKKYMKQLIALGIILVILIGYLPGIKKRFPRSMQKHPVIQESPIDGLGKRRRDRKGRFEKKFITVILPYCREKGSIKFWPAGVSGFTKVQVRAVNKSRMEITNANRFAAANIKFDGQKIEAGTKKYRVSPHVTIVAEQGKTRYKVDL